MKALNIAVIGAGVAGMSFAIMARKMGFKVTLFEKERVVSSIGAGVTLWPNACFVLDKLGCLKSIQEVGEMPARLEQYNQEGVLLASMNIDDINELSGYPTITILRRDLMRVLYSELLALDVSVEFASDISPSALEVIKQQFDLVVGGDGRMKSVVRSSLYPGEDHACYQGFINFIGISSIENKRFTQSISDFRGSHQRFGMVPVKNDECYWAAAWATNLNHAKDKSEWFDEIKSRFANWNPVITKAIDASKIEMCQPIFVHDIEPLPYWHKDNLLIFGDAAHASLPTSGQGACQALEDAWHLSKVLNEFENLEEALAHFYEVRFEKTRQAQMQGRSVAKTIFCGDNAHEKLILVEPLVLTKMWMRGLTD